jgi:hypothetical protein
MTATIKWTHYVASGKHHSWGKGKSLSEAMSNAGVTNTQRGWLAWEFARPVHIWVDEVSGGCGGERGVERRCIADRRYVKDQKAYPMEVQQSFGK